MKRPLPYVLHTPEKPIPNALKFVFGGAAGCCAAAIVQPLDLLKNRMQVRKPEDAKKTSFSVLSDVAKNEGFLALYNGLSAGLLRQVLYASTRLGIYQWLFDVFTVNETPPNLATKGALGMFAGACGAIVGTPADVALIRMTADGAAPPDQRRNYKSVFDALQRIKNEEGIKTWWKGGVPTVCRAMIANAAQLASYSQSKQMLLATGRFSDGLFLHFNASMIAGFVATVAGLPVDNVKTRFQNMRMIDGKPEFGGSMDVVRRILTKEGVPAFWKGFTPYYLRLGPLTVFTFVLLEQFNSMYRKFSK